MVITKTPEVVGIAGSAWMINTVRICERRGIKAEDHAGVAEWLIHAPWAHPVWHSYFLTTIHLRDLPGKPPAVIYLPNATHELLLYALDPDAACCEEIIRGEADVGASCLQPANFAAQFIAESDDDAGGRIAETVVLVCNGELNPDTDARSSWVSLFGDNMVCRD